MSPPVLTEDPAEYGEFVLPEIKVWTPEELEAEINKQGDALWAKHDESGEGLDWDKLKALAGEIKAKVDEKETYEIEDEKWDAVKEAEGGGEDPKSKDESMRIIRANFEKI